MDSTHSTIPNLNLNHDPDQRHETAVHMSGSLEVESAVSLRAVKIPVSPRMKRASTFQQLTDALKTYEKNQIETSKNIHAFLIKNKAEREEAKKLLLALRLQKPEDTDVLDKAHQTTNIQESSASKTSEDVVTKLVHFMTLAIWSYYSWKFCKRINYYTSYKQPNEELHDGSWLAIIKNLPSPPRCDPTNFYFNEEKDINAFKAKIKADKDTEKPFYTSKLANTIINHSHYYQYIAMTVSALLILGVALFSYTQQFFEKAFDYESLSKKTWFIVTIASISGLCTLIHIFIQALERLSNLYSQSQTGENLYKELLNFIDILIHEQTTIYETVNEDAPHIIIDTKEVFKGKVINPEAPGYAFLNGILGIRKNTFDDILKKIATTVNNPTANPRQIITVKEQSAKLLYECICRLIKGQ